MILKKILFIIFYSKKVFKKPFEKKVLIFDTAESEYLLKYFKKNSVEILSQRMSFEKIPKQTLNLYVVFKMLLNKKFSLASYLHEYIKIVNPKVIITMNDNNPFIYSIKFHHKNIKIILIQRAFRSMQKTDILYRLKHLKKQKNYFCDYFFMYNKKIGKIYQSFLKGKFIPIGSFKSNDTLKRKVKKNIDLLYVSVFRYQQPEKRENLIFFNNLNKFCLNKKIKLHILGSIGIERENEYNAEKKYYKQMFKKINYELIPRTKIRNAYKIVDKSKIILNIDSSLGYEAAARGNMVCFFCIRKKTYPLNSLQFGWPNKMPYKGPFWTDNSVYKEFQRLMNYASNKKYKNEYKQIINKTIKFDEGNKKFKNLISRLGI